MGRLTIRLPDAEIKAIQAKAAADGVSVSDVVRQALAATAPTVAGLSDIVGQIVDAVSARIQSAVPDTRPSRIMRPDASPAPHEAAVRYAVGTDPDAGAAWIEDWTDATAFDTGDDMSAALRDKVESLLADGDRPPAPSTPIGSDWIDIRDGRVVTVHLSAVEMPLQQVTVAPAPRLVDPDAEAVMTRRAAEIDRQIADIETRVARHIEQFPDPEDPRRQLALDVARDQIERLRPPVAAYFNTRLHHVEA